MQHRLPIVLLVSAIPVNNKYLAQVRREIDDIESIFNPLHDKSLLVRTIKDATLEQIAAKFREFNDRITLFHFAGHANPENLIINAEDSGESHEVNLVEYLKLQNSLQLVFLNGCNTRHQVQNLVNGENFLPTAIGTITSVKDPEASAIAIEFYRNLVVGQDSINEAFEKTAKLLPKGFNGSPVKRHLYTTQIEITKQDSSFSWEIHYRKQDTTTRRLKLHDILGDPLAGLNLNPKSYRNLPAIPYKALHHYTLNDAAIFFGRGREIRKLYERLLEEPPIILFYGQSGVGKSSLLFAGLLPRVADKYNVQYIRRKDELGLAGSLLAALQTAAVEGDVENNESPLGAWKAVETADEKKRPLVIILDQVEEIYTKKDAEDQNGKTPHLKLEEEITAFVELLKILFADKAGRPKGKLILAYRKDYDRDIQHFLRAALPSIGIFNEFFLMPLNEDGVREAVNGIPGNPKLQEKYQIFIPENERQLADDIAGDLCRDRVSPIAPVLQTLLYRMWEKKKGEASAVYLTREYYQKEWKERSGLKTFFGEQMAKINREFPEEEKIGLVLDILFYFVTEHRTAATRSFEEIQKRYSHHSPDKLYRLLQCLKDHYLLSDLPENEEQPGDTLSLHPENDDMANAKINALAHDTLGMVVYDAYQQSQNPAQRAAKILDSKLPDITNGERNTYLTLREIRKVAKGRPGMPELSPEVSMLLKTSQRRLRRQISITVFLMLILTLAIYGLFDAKKYSDVRGEIVNKELRDIYAEKNFYEKDLNPGGTGLDNWYGLISDSVVYDSLTCLYWQRFSSPEELSIWNIGNYIEELNMRKFGGSDQWRLPTIEEAMSLMKKDTSAAGQHIDTVFAVLLGPIWTDATATTFRQWCVNYNSGQLSGAYLIESGFVRLVYNTEKPFQNTVFGVRKMIIDSGYYDYNYNPHDVEVKSGYRLESDSVVYDSTTSLYWQRSGSREGITYKEANNYIKMLNTMNNGQGYGGYTDWRLPTLAEAMSLIERENNIGYLYIDPIFDPEQGLIWTANRNSASVAWSVYFNFGNCNLHPVGINTYARAVRS